MTKIKNIIAILFMGFLISCGGGGSGSSSSPSQSSASSATSYQAGLSIGDLGDLTLDTRSLTYELRITSSSFGLSGKVLRGDLVDNGDGTYKVKGTDYGTIFAYPNYAVMVVKIDKEDPDFKPYFDTHPDIKQSFYAPVFSLNKQSLLSTVDQVTSNLESKEFRSASFGFEITGGTTNYSAEASRGIITKLSDTSFSVRSCSNDGASVNNSRLASCSDQLASTTTFTYDDNTRAWLVTPTPSATRSVRAYFVNDTQANQVVGYIDTSDSSQTSSKFALVSIVPEGALYSPNGKASSFTSFQACSSSSNCAGEGTKDQGISYDPSVTIGTAPFIQTSTYMSDGPCSYLISPNSPVNGFMDAVYYDSFTGNGVNPPNGICTKSGDKPDNIMFFFGVRTVNGKLQYLGAMAGYDKTVTSGPSQKFSIDFVSEN